MAQIQDLATGWRIENGVGRVRLMDAAGNPLQAQNGAAEQATQEGVLIAGLNDSNIRHIQVDRWGKLGMARPQLLLHEQVEGATLNAYRWTSAATTMTTVQAATGITLNASSLTTINTNAMLTSAKQFAKVQRVPLHFRARARVAAVANSQIDFGFGAPSAATALTNGAFFVQTTGGQLQPAIVFNSGAMITGSAITINPANYYIFDIMVDDDNVKFTVQDTSSGLIISEQTIAMPLSQQRMWAASHLPAFFRVFNGGVAPASAPLFVISDCFVGGMDLDAGRSWETQVAGNSQGASALPTTYAQAAQWANSAEAAAATLSNTAAGYTTLGGRFLFAPLAGAATDFALFGFQVPAPYTLFIKGVYIDTANIGAAVATSLTLLEWAIATDSTAVSLATATYLRRSLGKQSFAIGAGIGATATPVSRQFGVPLKCDPGKFLAIILRMPVATVTASEQFSGIVDIDGWFE